MFDHVKIGVSEFATSKNFFLKALEPLGVTACGEGIPTYGIELISDSQTSFILFQTDQKPAHLHLAFVARKRSQVDAFYRRRVQWTLSGVSILAASADGT